MEDDNNVDNDAIGQDVVVGVCDGGKHRQVDDVIIACGQIYQRCVEIRRGEKMGLGMKENNWKLIYCYWLHEIMLLRSKRWLYLFGKCVCVSAYVCVVTF